MQHAATYAVPRVATFAAKMQGHSEERDIARVLKAKKPQNAKKEPYRDSRGDESICGVCNQSNPIFLLENEATRMGGSFADMFARGLRAARLTATGSLSRPMTSRPSKRDRKNMRESSYRAQSV